MHNPHASRQGPTTWPPTSTASSPHTVRSPRPTTGRSTRWSSGREADAAGARPFAAASCRGESALAVIGEIKRRSPSKGDAERRPRPGGAGPAYDDGRRRVPVGAHRQPSSSAARPPTCRRPGRRVDLPVLRKDFTVSAATCATPGSWAPTACCSSPPRSTTASWSTCTRWPPTRPRRAGRDPRRGRARVARSTPGRRSIGVNQRDLVTFEVDHARAVRMAAVDARRRRPVAESGVRGQADARRLRRAGYDAVLVGETLVTAADPAAAIAELRVPDPKSIRRASRPARYVRRIRLATARNGDVRQDLRDHQRGRRAARRGDGRRRGRLHLRPVAAPGRRRSRSYDITRRLPPEILTVGVFRDELPSRVIDIVHRAGREGRPAPRPRDRRRGRRGRRAACAG